jgi:hypothetical protein
LSCAQFAAEIFVCQAETSIPKTRWALAGTTRPVTTDNSHARFIQCAHFFWVEGIVNMNGAV